MRATLKISFRPGTTISEAYTEAQRIGSQLLVIIEFVFNDVICTAHPDGSVEKGVETFFNPIILNEGKLKLSFNN